MDVRTHPNHHDRSRSAAIATATSAAGSIDTLIVSREIGGDTAARVIGLDLEKAADTATRGFWKLHAKRRREISNADAVRSCGPDPGCLARVLRDEGIGYVVYVIANWSEQPPLLSVAVIDIDRRELLSTAFETPTNRFDESVRRLTEQTLRESGYQTGARLTLTVRPPEATIDLHPERGPPSVDPRAGAVEPGRYELVVDADGYDPERRKLDLAAGSVETIDVELHKQTLLVEEWWFWTGAAAIVAAGVVVGLAAGGALTHTEVCYESEIACR